MMMFAYIHKPYTPVRQTCTPYILMYIYLRNMFDVYILQSSLKITSRYESALSTNVTNEHRYVVNVGT